MEIYGSWLREKDVHKKHRVPLQLKKGEEKKEGKKERGKR